MTVVSTRTRMAYAVASKRSKFDQATLPAHLQARLASPLSLLVPVTAPQNLALRPFGPPVLRRPTPQEPTTSTAVAASCHVMQEARDTSPCSGTMLAGPEYSTPIHRSACSQAGSRVPPVSRSHFPHFVPFRLFWNCPAEQVSCKPLTRSQHPTFPPPLRLRLPFGIADMHRMFKLDHTLELTNGSTSHLCRYTAVSQRLWSSSGNMLAPKTPGQKHPPSRSIALLSG